MFYKTIRCLPHSIAPLFLSPDNKKPFRPFARTLSRSSSTSIYAPPPSASGIVPLPRPGPAPVSGRTPGRRGEKRGRQNGNDEQRKRRIGKITDVPEKISPFDVPEQSKKDEEQRDRNMIPHERSYCAASPSQMSVAASEGFPGEEEDIFGLRAASMNSIPSAGGRSSIASDKVAGGEDNSEEIADVGKAKRTRVPQQILDNKAVWSFIFPVK